MAGIIGYGVYIPRYRLEQKEAAMPWGSWAPGEKAVCGADEDVVTMAAEAMDNAIKHAGIDPAKIGTIHIGTASSPYIEQYIAPILAETLGLHPEATMIDYSGSLNALANALLGCLDAIAAKRIKYGIVIGGENRETAPGAEGDATFGAGAVAMVIGTGGTIADLEGMHTHSTLFLDRWHAAKDTWVSNFNDYRFDREYGYQQHIAQACKGLLKELGTSTQDYNHVVFPQPDDRITSLPAKSLGIQKEQLAPAIASTLGDLGSCSAFISLAGVLDKAKPGEKILLASYGSGASNAMSLVVRGQISRKRKQTVPLEKYINRKQYTTYTSYMRVREHVKRAPY
ncbi:MAG: hydroxymethylglutaryl-CoA synthase [Dehalococcoidia bacterium]|nr:MAG: hydroxymethylglutaryl-CoA synthase [Dehalococcoidia bacterium]